MKNKYGKLPNNLFGLFTSQSNQSTPNRGCSSNMAGKLVVMFTEMFL